MPAQVAPLFSASAHGLKCDSFARVSYNRSVFDDLKIDCFEGNAKAQWMDEQAGWCHLCNEPFGTTIGVHMSDRDHGCLAYFLLLYSQYPRTWSAFDVVGASMERQFRRVGRGCAGGQLTSQEHLHTTSDAVRRSELEAILRHLSAQGPNQALFHTLQGAAPLALWVSGERIFKVNMSRLAAIYLPPMAPGIHSTFTQKCWGRSNQERGYEALNIASIHRHFGVEPKVNRDGRAFFMRSLIWELHAALDCRPELSEVARLLLEEALRRLSFELMFLQTMYYMNRVQGVVRRLGAVPTLADLHALNSL